VRLLNELISNVSIEISPGNVIHTDSVVNPSVNLQKDECCGFVL